jgi:hypothetical protein
MFFLMNEGSSLAVTKQYANGTGQILPLLQSRKPKKKGGLALKVAKLWQVILQQRQFFEE